MSANPSQAVDIRFLPDAILVWFISAVVLLPIAALTAELTQCSEAGLAYISSAASFLTALAAGAKAIRTRKKGAVVTAIISALAIIILALTLGFVIAGDKLQADGILSLVTFTFSGALVGSVFFSGSSRKPRRNIGPKPGRRKN